MPRARVNVVEVGSPYAAVRLVSATRALWRGNAEAWLASDLVAAAMAAPSLLLPLLLLLGE